jgi:hypothetical protein
MGRVSRESRLCFILLFTLADDAGRLRGNSRMLASLLYPYDDDAKKHIDGWLTELHKEECITRYEAEGDQYIQLNKWLQHQKIDKPSPSKIPSPDNSLPFSNPREDSIADQGRDQGMEGNIEPNGSLSSQPTAERTPSQRLLEIFHEKCEYLPKVSVFSEARKKVLKARFTEVMKTEKWTVDQTVEWFGDFYQLVNQSKFLTGRAPPGRDGRTFKADWDWVHAPSNFVKIIEGKYEG